LLAKVISAALRTYPWRPLQRIPGNYKTILDVFEQANSRSPGPRESQNSQV